MKLNPPPKSKHQSSWDDFWKDICTNEDGSINLEQIKKELSDYEFLLEQVPSVYCAITNDQMSKTTYYAHDVIRVYEDCFKGNVVNEIENFLEDMNNTEVIDDDTFKKLLEETHNYFQI